MRVEQIQMPLSNKLVHDYIYDYEKVSSYYSYDPYRQESYTQRLSWLSSYPVSHREELADGLRAYNQAVGNHAKAMENIEHLRQSDTYVVVGGQQAGILTGPLYTIHKALTLLRTAELQERLLGKKIIPVFWIAGEDHDYEEVNHVYLQTPSHEIKKAKLGMEPEGKTSITHLQVEDGLLEAFIETYFAEQIDTEFSVELRKGLLGFARESTTLTDFFARVMAWLFGEKGLVLIDSALPFVRELEKRGFSRVIKENEALNRAVLEQGNSLAAHGYHRQVETESDNAHFFLYRQGQRIGVIRQNGTYQTRDGAETYTEEELLVLLEEQPERFSTNVVTRPMMQELLFPTLAFIGGPGEIAYWGLYRRYFELFGLEMPILLPRLTFSLIEGTVQKTMRKYDMTVEELFTGLDARRVAYLEQQNTFNLEEKLAAVKNQIKALYQPIIEDAAKIELGLKNLGEKNVDKILEQVGYYEKKISGAFLKKHESVLRQFERTEAALFPMDKPQERVYNIFGYVNKYGMDWFNAFLSYPFEINRNHNAIFID